MIEKNKFMFQYAYGNHNTGGGKIRNARGRRGENERQWKTKVNRNTNISSMNRVTREFLEVSRFKVMLHGTIRNDGF